MYTHTYGQDLGCVINTQINSRCVANSFVTFITQITTATTKLHNVGQLMKLVRSILIALHLQLELCAQNLNKHMFGGTHMRTLTCPTIITSNTWHHGV